VLEHGRAGVVLQSRQQGGGEDAPHAAAVQGENLKSLRRLETSGGGAGASDGPDIPIGARRSPALSPQASRAKGQRSVSPTSRCRSRRAQADPSRLTHGGVWALVARRIRPRDRRESRGPGTSGPFYGSCSQIPRATIGGRTRESRRSRGSRMELVGTRTGDLLGAMRSPGECARFAGGFGKEAATHRAENHPQFAGVPKSSGTWRRPRGKTSDGYPGRETRRGEEPRAIPRERRR
jgi:hypothetical protein